MQDRIEVRWELEPRNVSTLFSFFRGSCWYRGLTIGRTGIKEWDEKRKEFSRPLLHLIPLEWIRTKNLDSNFCTMHARETGNAAWVCVCVCSGARDSRLSAITPVRIDLDKIKVGNVNCRRIRMHGTIQTRPRISPILFYWFFFTRGLSLYSTWVTAVKNQLLLGRSDILG